jgi:hypothetical protein
MSVTSLHQFLVLYMWFGLVVLMLFWALIGRFYQRFSGKKTYYKWHILAALPSGIVAVRSASNPFLQLDALNTLLSFGAMFVFLILIIHLYRLMMGNKSNG